MRLFFSNIYYYLYLIDVNNLIWGNFWVPLFVMQYFVICTKWYNYVKSTTIYLPRLRSYCILFSLYYIWFRDLKTHYCMHTHFPVEVRYVYFFFYVMYLSSVEHDINDIIEHIMEGDHPYRRIAGSLSRMGT